MGTRLGTALGTRLGTALGSDLAGQRVIYGGADWDTTNRMRAPAGQQYKGNAAGHTVAVLVRFDSQVVEAPLIDFLDATGKGLDVRQNTSTTVVWRNAKASGADWWVSAPYTPAPDIGKLVMLVMVYTGPGGFIEHWANDEKVGADTAADGYVQSGSITAAIACFKNGTFPHTGLRWFGCGGWDRVFTPAEVHALYDTVAATGQIPLGLANQSLIINVTADAVPPSFPSTLRNLVTPGTGDFTFVTGSAAGINLVSEVV